VALTGLADSFLKRFVGQPSDGDKVNSDSNLIDHRQCGKERSGKRTQVLIFGVECHRHRSSGREELLTFDEKAHAGWIWCFCELHKVRRRRALKWM